MQGTADESHVMKVNPMLAAAEVNACSSSMMHAHKQTVLCSGGPKRCNCKKSKCLKLYCDCFAAGVYCQNCSCSCCLNTEENKYVFRMTFMCMCYITHHCTQHACCVQWNTCHLFLPLLQCIHLFGKAKSVMSLDADTSAACVTGT